MGSKTFHLLLCIESFKKGNTMNKFQKKHRFTLATINMAISLALFIIIAILQVDITLGSEFRSIQILAWVLYGSALIFAAYILFSDREYGVKWAWLLLIFFLPFFGMFTFYILGRSPREIIKLRKKRKIAKKMRGKWDHLVKPDYDVANQTISDAAQIARHPVYAKTNVRVLEENQPFTEILNVVLKAQHHIHFEFYMMHEEALTKPIFDVLCQKAESGVKVRVLLDYVGTLMSFFQSHTIQRLLAAGVEVEFYNKTFSMLFDSTVLYRNHRKIIVVDGVEGFTGGYNFDGKYGNKNCEKPYWRDLHLYLRGDAVHQLQSIFLVDWYSATQKEIVNSTVETEYFPRCEEIGSGAVQIVPDGYDAINTTVNDTYFRLITQAKQTVDIATPYFVPTPELLMALKMAARTGIRVRILLPGVPDKKSVYAASRSFISELLYSGVEVYLMNDTFVHQKLIIIDGENAAVGTSNFDLRSIHTNLELMVFMYKHLEVKRLSQLFNEDIGNSKRISLKTWTKRPWSSKILERFFKLFSALF